MERAARGVCRGVVFENLDVGAKLQSHGIEVGVPVPVTMVDGLMVTEMP
jgi:hypothetical protein